MSCVFCAIASGEAPASLVSRDEHTVAFLDARPVFKGHVLVVPRAHADDLAALAPEASATLFVAARSIALALETALACDGAFVALNNKVSQSVPHVHVHVVPRRKKDGLRGFFWPRKKYESDGERDDYARRIRDALATRSS